MPRDIPCCILILTLFQFLFSLISFLIFNLLIIIPKLPIILVCGYMYGFVKLLWTLFSWLCKNFFLKIIFVFFFFMSEPFFKIFITIKSYIYIYVLLFFSWILFFFSFFSIFFTKMIVLTVSNHENIYT